MMFFRALFSVIFVVACVFTAVVLPSPAFADPKPWVFSWFARHWDEVENNKFAPYLENAKHPINARWAHNDWYVEDWIASVKNPQDIVRNLYKSGVIRGQKTENGVPVLIVGPEFYRLSGYDKRRVAAYLDIHHEITQRSGIFILKDWNTGKQIGIYSKHGLQLQ